MELFAKIVNKGFLSAAKGYLLYGDVSAKKMRTSENIISEA